MFEKQTPLAKDKVVYRGITDAHSRLATRYVKNPDDLVGAEILDKGYISTSKDPEFATKEFSSPQGAVIRLKVSAGTKVLDIPSMIDKGESYKDTYGPLIGNPRKSGFMAEQEVLLPRNSRFKITGYEKEEGGRILWHAKLIQQENRIR